LGATPNLPGLPPSGEKPPSHWPRHYLSHMRNLTLEVSQAYTTSPFARSDHLQGKWSDWRGFCAALTAAGAKTMPKGLTE